MPGEISAAMLLREDSSAHGFGLKCSARDSKSIVKYISLIHSRYMSQNFNPRILQRTCWNIFNVIHVRERKDIHEITTTEIVESCKDASLGIF